MLPDPLHQYVTPENVGIFVVLLLSVALHESAHAYVARWCGDDTAERLGRKTLNPLKHLDLVMSVLLPAVLLFGGIFANTGFLFGAGKPVPVVRTRLRSPARDFALVAVAGPLTNVLLALLATLIFVVGSRQGWVVYGEFSYNWTHTAIKLNLVLAIFNLIPVPPLDGSRLLAFFLPRPIREGFYRLDLIGFPILIVLFVTGVLQRVFESTYVPVYVWWSDHFVRWI